MPEYVSCGYYIVTKEFLVTAPEGGFRCTVNNMCETLQPGCNESLIPQITLYHPIAFTLQLCNTLFVPTRPRYCLFSIVTC